MRTPVRLVAAAALALGLVLLAPAGPAAAHPLGNFSVNLYSGIAVAPGEVTITYVLDMAEIPTFQEMPAIDRDGDGQAGAAERAAWAGAKAEELRRNLDLTVDGRPVALSVVESSMTLGPGQADLPILRLEATLTGAIEGDAGRIEYRDRNYPGRVGWREVTAVGLRGAAVEGSSVPAESLSDELRAYPQDLLSSPLSVREASFSFAPGSSGADASSRGETASAGARQGVAEGAFAGLVSRPALSAPIVLLSVLLAVAFGALHALAPGHGKTIMAAYLVGAGGRLRQALAGGVAVSLMHTASVVAVGLLVLSAQQLFPPERVYPWLGLTAGVAALALGSGLLWARARTAPKGHGHPHVHAARPILSRGGLGALALSGGLLPSPTAVVVLLASVALHRVAFGVVLIAAFSVGLAGALTAIGLLAIRARDLLSGRLKSSLSRLVPFGGAGAIVVVGAVLVARAAVQL